MERENVDITNWWMIEGVTISRGLMYALYTAVKHMEVLKEGLTFLQIGKECDDPYYIKYGNDKYWEVYSYTGNLIKLLDIIEFMGEEDWSLVTKPPVLKTMHFPTVELINKHTNLRIMPTGYGVNILTDKIAVYDWKYNEYLKRGIPFPNLSEIKFSPDEEDLEKLYEKIKSIIEGQNQGEEDE